MTEGMEDDLHLLDDHPSSFLLDPSFSHAEDWLCADSGEGLEEDLLFLQEKQAIFSRIMQTKNEEEAFKASAATRLHFRGTLDERKSDIWDEAQDIVDTLNRQNGKQSKTKGGKAKGSRSASGRKKAAKAIHASVTSSNKRQCAIDTSCVARVGANSLKGSTDLASSLAAARDQPTKSASGCPTPDGMSNIKPLTLPKFTEFSGLGIPASINLNRTNDVRGWIHSMLDPLSSLHHHGIDMAKALALSTVPKLVISSKAPFMIIHANKAFFEARNEQQNTAIGKPILNLLLETTGQTELPPLNDMETVWKRLFHTTEGVGVHLAPVVEQSKTKGRVVTNYLLQFAVEQHHHTSLGNAISKGAFQKGGHAIKDNRIIEMVG
eukprot:CAMPEP_0119563266 /NCGR_PEP_ID=MMETSP1352-20130426/22873_1 /TAXON_ID=265584 /ORGANISM="Stauroneis constricta, Strain CCMP1120" /LENGTH=378 /DNA_ID=CAMNT_0007611821 /DNA_START=110 /DNA_END=1246 /DNA_ORIENTATION=+